jgi:hypothetical protein
MSIEMAMIETFCSSVSWSKKPCRVWALRPGRGPHAPGFDVVGHTRQEPAVDPVGNLAHADVDQSVQPVVIELVGDHSFEDL